METLVKGHKNLYKWLVVPLLYLIQYSRLQDFKLKFSIRDTQTAGDYQLFKALILIFWYEPVRDFLKIFGPSQSRFRIFSVLVQPGPGLPKIYRPWFWPRSWSLWKIYRFKFIKFRVQKIQPGSSRIPGTVIFLGNSFSIRFLVFVVILYLIVIF